MSLTCILLVIILVVMMYPGEGSSLKWTPNALTSTLLQLVASLLSKKEKADEISKPSSNHEE